MIKTWLSKWSAVNSSSLEQTWRWTPRYTSYVALHQIQTMSGCLFTQMHKEADLIQKLKFMEHSWCKKCTFFFFKQANSWTLTATCRSHVLSWAGITFTSSWLMPVLCPVPIHGANESWGLLQRCSRLIHQYRNMVILFRSLLFVLSEEFFSWSMWIWSII